MQRLDVIASQNNKASFIEKNKMPTFTKGKIGQGGMFMLTPLKASPVTSLKRRQNRWINRMEHVTWWCHLWRCNGVLKLTQVHTTTRELAVRTTAPLAVIRARQ
jgi:hypothetical protein